MFKRIFIQHNEYSLFKNVYILNHLFLASYNRISRKHKTKVEKNLSELLITEAAFITLCTMELHPDAHIGRRAILVLAQFQLNVIHTILNLHFLLISDVTISLIMHQIKQMCLCGIAGLHLLALIL